MKRVLPPVKAPEAPEPVKKPAPKWKAPKRRNRGMVRLDPNESIVAQVRRLI